MNETKGTAACRTGHMWEALFMSVNGKPSIEPGFCKVCREPAESFASKNAGKEPPAPPPPPPPEVTPAPIPELAAAVRYEKPVEPIYPKEFERKLKRDAALFVVLIVVAVSGCMTAVFNYAAITVMMGGK